jgi:hypothetical protein
MRFTSLTLALALTSSSLLAGSAVAGTDKKNYPGAFCIDRDDGASRMAAGVDGSVINTATSSLMMVCPAVKDFDDINSATAFVIDERDDAFVACRLRTVAHDLSDTNVWATNSSLYGHGDEVVALSFGHLAAESLGTYVLSCSVPSKSEEGHFSGIVGYQISENEY